MDPAIVPPGRVIRATNCRFRTGQVEPRKGISILRCMKADGTTPFTTTGKANFFKIAPPNAYQDWVGTGAPFAPGGVNNCIVGCYFSEISTLTRVNIRLDGLEGSEWDTFNPAFFPVGVIQNSALANSNYGTLALVGQDFQFAISLSSLGGVMSGHYLKIIVTSSAGPMMGDLYVTGYTTYA